MTKENIEVLTDDNFEAKIGNGVTLVDFFAEWCGPCRMMAPILEEIATEFSGKVQFAKIDIDKENKSASAHHVTSIPTLVLYKEGKEIDRVVGLRDADSLKEFVSKGV